MQLLACCSMVLYIYYLWFSRAADLSLRQQGTFYFMFFVVWLRLNNEERWNYGMVEAN